MLVDIRQSPEYARYLKTLGWKVERITEVNYFIKRFPIIGSVLKIQHPEQFNNKTIQQLVQKYRAFQIIIEPKDEMQAKFLSSVGFRLSKSPYLPTKTLILDLTRSKGELFNGFKKDAISAIRRNKKGESKVREVATNQDLENFLKAWKSSVRFSRYVPSLNQLSNLRRSFKKNSPLFLASHNVNGTIIGGAIFTRSLHDIAYYWQGFTNKEGRTSLSQYALVWEGILWAKSKSCKIFDFEGIFDPRFPNKTWLGFTHFKKSFGGTEIAYPGTYIKNRFPI